MLPAGTHNIRRCILVGLVLGATMSHEVVAASPVVVETDSVAIDSASSHRRPPLRWSAVGRQFLVGYGAGLLGILGGAVPGLVAAAIAGEPGVAITSTLVGYATGTAIGVHQAGSRDGVTGSLRATVIGSFAGGILLGLPTEGTGLFYGAPIGAVIGFQTTRRLSRGQIVDSGERGGWAHSWGLNLSTSWLEADTQMGFTGPAADSSGTDG